jgi:hypothetical protein
MTLVVSIKESHDYDKIEASSWLLAALLNVFNTNTTATVMVDVVIPWYTSLKTFAQQQQQGDMKLYQAVFYILECALKQQEQLSGEEGMIQRSAAVLGMCGFLDGLLTAHSLQLNLQQQRQGDVAVLVDNARGAVLSACRQADSINGNNIVGAPTNLLGSSSNGSSSSSNNDNGSNGNNIVGAPTNLLGSNSNGSKKMFHDACALGTLHILQNHSVDSALKHHFDELSSTILMNIHLSTLLENALTLRKLPLSRKNSDSGDDNDDIITPTLKQQLEGAVGRETAALARSVSRLYRLISKRFQPQHKRHSYILDTLVNTSRDMHATYAEFMLHTFPPSSHQHQHPQLSKNDATSLRALLDRIFMSFMVILLTIWEEEEVTEKKKRKRKDPSSSSTTTTSTSTQNHHSTDNFIQVASSKILLVLSNLQFCRMQLSQYNTLLEETIKVLIASAAASEEGEDVVSLYLVNNGLPCYSKLIQPYNYINSSSSTSIHQNTSPPSTSAWLVGGVGAMRIQFMMIILSTLVSALPQQVLLERLAPLALLFVRHPHPSTSAAANNLLCAIISVIRPMKGDEVAQLLPFYLHQALKPQQSSSGDAGGGGGGGVEGKPVQPHVVAQVLSMFVRHIPPTRPEVVLLCFERLISFGANLSVTKEKGETEEEEVNRGVALFAIAAALLAVVDVGVLEECAGIIERGVVRISTDDSSTNRDRFVEKVLIVIYESIARSDDCVRKTGLVRWYQKLAAQVREN